MSTFAEAWAGLKRGEKWRLSWWNPDFFITLDDRIRLHTENGTRYFGVEEHIDSEKWERVDERPTMDWAGACRAMLEGATVERDGSKIKLNDYDDLVWDDGGVGVGYRVSSDDLKATDWREVKP